MQITGCTQEQQCQIRFWLSQSWKHCWDGKRKVWERKTWACDISIIHHVSDKINRFDPEDAVNMVSLDICCHISHRCFNFTVTYPEPSKKLKRMCNTFHNKIIIFWLLGIYISIHLKLLPSCGLCVTSTPPDYHAVSRLLWLLHPQVFHLYWDIPTPLFSVCAPCALLVYHL